jgi:hypothetical protein
MVAPPLHLRLHGYSGVSAPRYPERGKQVFVELDPDEVAGVPVG